MKRHNIAQRVFVAASIGCFLFACGENGAADLHEPDAWQIADPFVKRLDSGAISGEPIDPRKPPRLAIWLLSSGSNRLDADADYYNRTRSPVTLHGRTVEDPIGGARRFYPSARLEVSNQHDRGWEVIGRSPPVTAGVPADAVMLPVKIGIANPQAKSNRSCVIDMNPFRQFVGKFRYGRVVLENGDGSQILVLSDLLPPKRSVS